MAIPNAMLIQLSKNGLERRINDEHKKAAINYISLLFFENIIKKIINKRKGDLT